MLVSNINFNCNSNIFSNILKLYQKPFPLGTMGLLKVGWKTSNYNLVGNLLSGFNPDRFYENLVKTQDFGVLLKSEKQEEKEDFESYWDDKILKDPKVPDMSDSEKRRNENFGATSMVYSLLDTKTKSERFLRSWVLSGVGNMYRMLTIM